MELERKIIPFALTDTKEAERNGVKIGIIEGYAATWDLDRGNDIIQKGAFSLTVKDHQSKARPIRMLFGHDYANLIGGYPQDDMREDAKGLHVVGEINLETQGGREAYALAKQGVLTDMSIGFRIPENGSERKQVEGKSVRIIKAIDLYEISLVPEPMNTQANIMAVKSLYAKHNVEMPADGLVNVTIVEQCKTMADLENLLRDVSLTANAAKAFISRCKKGAESREGITEQSDVAELLRKGAEDLQTSMMLNLLR